MRPEVRDQIVALLSAEVEANSENLDELEGQILESLREIAQGTLQAVTAVKKGATQGVDNRVDAVRRPGSSATEAEPS